ncbi:unnamed protein product, partial [marine sediment metagenome]
FILSGDALFALTDTGGAETATAIPSVPTLTAWHKYKILAYRNAVEFWVDGVMEVRHTTTPGPDEDLPDINAHGNFLITTDGVGVGAAELHIATISIRPGVLV